MKKILTIVLFGSLAVSTVFIGNVTASASSMNARPQVGYIKRKSKKVYYRGKHGTKVAYRKTKHGTKKTYHKSKRVTKRTYSKTKDKVTS